eukprot:1875035-Alexandrium_andersonii.AAC.1
MQTLTAWLEGSRPENHLPGCRQSILDLSLKLGGRCGRRFNDVSVQGRKVRATLKRKALRMHNVSNQMSAWGPGASGGRPWAEWAANGSQAECAVERRGAD